MNYYQRALELKDEIISHRRYFHKNAEVGLYMPKAQAYVMEKLSEYGLEPKRIRFVHPFVDKEPNIVLIEALKGGNSRVKIEPPLIVYEKPGVYSEEIYRIYGYEKEE